MQHEIYQELNEQEFEVLEDTAHPHITRVFELMEDSRNYYIIMEYISGGNLLEKLSKVGSFTEGQVSRIIEQLLLALTFMHGKNIMHRDLKAENIMVDNSSSNQGEVEDINIKLTDFGFATKFSNEYKETLSLGSPLYMAPEICAEQEYDNKVDVWSVGVITYVLLTGVPPFVNRSGN